MAQSHEVKITADRLQVLPTQPIESVFGFGKNAYETPRALTSISNEMLDKVIITEIDDLVALTPGSFTQSFFGVAGSLDVRGTPGENYFRGVKRIDNPGNYPQAIGASDRIDVVRGPASPIYGPSKIGGYLNFVPEVRARRLPASRCRKPGARSASPRAAGTRRCSRRRSADPARSATNRSATICTASSRTPAATTTTRRR